VYESGRVEDAPVDSEPATPRRAGVRAVKQVELTDADATLAARKGMGERSADGEADDDEVAGADPGDAGSVERVVSQPVVRSVEDMEGDDDDAPAAKRSRGKRSSRKRAPRKRAAKKTASGDGAE
jgi:hypothetical protein